LGGRARRTPVTLRQENYALKKRNETKERRKQKLPLGRKTGSRGRGHAAIRKTERARASNLEGMGSTKT